MEIAAIRGAIAVAAGTDHILTLKGDGTVWTIGRDGSTPVLGIGGAIAISAGATQSMALGSDGMVWTWGDRSVPVQIPGLADVIGVASGAYHSLALKADGTVWAWGDNTYGQLGDGSSTNRGMPTRVASLDGVTAVAAGASHSLALKADGTVWAWGDNTYGQLGDGTRITRYAPVLATNVGGAAVAIAAGPAALYSLAIVAPIAISEPGAQVISAAAYTYNINTVAGNGSPNSSGENGPATAAGMGPLAIARDANGNLFLTDDGPSTSGIRVRKINPGGTITTVVNDATSGCNQSGGLQICVNHAGGITTDSRGNVYFTYSDGGPEAVLKLDTSNTLSFFAGGSGGFAGDGGLAKLAEVDPRDGGMTFDAAGNFYVADSGNDRVRKVSPSGIITTVAGNGTHGFSGDSGPAAAAAMSSPTAVAVDAAGNLYIADGNNNRIRKVDLSGTITTIAGSGAIGGSGYAGDGEPATLAQLQHPNGLAVDSTGRLFINDGNGTIRVVDTAGFISSIAGSPGNAGFTGDGGPAIGAKFSVSESLALGGGNSIYFVDGGNYRIRQLTVACTYNIAGVMNIGNNANNVGQSFPDAGGAGYVPVTANPGSCAWTAVSNVPWITVTSGNSGSGNGGVNFSVDSNSGPARTGALRIAGITFTVQQDGATCNFSASPVSAVYGVAAANGALTIATAAGCGWSVLNNNPEFLSITGGATGNGNGPIAYRVALNTSAASRIGTLSVIDVNGLRAATFTITQAGLTSAVQYTINSVAGNGSTTYSGDSGPATLAGLIPAGLARDTSGNLFLTDRTFTGGARVRKVGTGGIISTIAGGGNTDPYNIGGVAIGTDLSDPIGIAVDSAGDVYFTHSNGGSVVFRVDTSGVLKIVAGGGSGVFSGDGGPATAASLNSPTGLCIDLAGNLYIADTGNRRIRKVSTSGIITTVAGTGDTGFSGDGGPAIAAQIDAVSSIALDRAGNLYLADNFNQRIRKVDTSGTITTVGGGAAAKIGGYAGDGGPATAAQLSFPNGVAVDSDGRIFIADQNNNVIRMVDTSGIITTIAGNQNKPGNAGDGGAATSAQMSGPTALVIGPDGTVSFIDSRNNRIRQLTPTVPVSTPVTGIVLTQSGFTFQAVQGGGNPSPESFQILNTTGKTISFSLSSTTVSGGSGWLTVSPLSGSIGAGQTAMITVNVDPTQISPASPRDYYGQIELDAPGVANAPQTVSVVLNLLPSNTAQPPTVEPTGVVFLGSMNGGNPAAQAVRVTNLSSRTSSFSGTITVAGITGAQTLFAVSPASGSVAPNQPATLQISADLSGLAAGVYRGTLALQFQPDNVTRSVALVLVIASPGSTAAGDGPNPKAPCTPTRLVPTLTLLGADFSTLAGWPANIQAVVVDDCTNYIDSGTVTATFSNSDPQLPLQDSGAHIGQWSVTWAAQHALSSGLTVTVSARSNGLSGSTAVTGGALANPNVPLVFTNGTVSAGSYSPSATPSAGELISIFGAQLADSTQSADALPLPTSMQNASVTLAGVKLPLVFTSTGQINAQIPYAFPGGVTLPLVVQHGDRLSAPQPVTLATAEPAIFTTNLLGAGQGFIFVVPGPGQQILADPSAPAHAGDVILIYCTGLGPVDPPVTAGQPVPSDALHSATSKVTLTIGGVSVTPAFAGLTPGFTGLYQINATKMPDGVAPGDQVPVTITVGGVYQSPPVTMAVK
jgi:uncharacterized protein (TIGR03437 family)